MSQPRRLSRLVPPALTSLLLVLVGMVGVASPAKAATDVDVNFLQLSFSHTTAGVNYANVKFPGTAANAGKANGDIVLWKSLLTVEGITIDAIVTTNLINSAVISKYGDGSTGSPGDFKIDTSGGAANNAAAFTFSFCESGQSVITSPGPSGSILCNSPLTLQNVQVTGKDIDGPVTGGQFNTFEGIRSDTLSSPTTNLTASRTPAVGTPYNAKFTGLPGPRNDIPEDQVVVSYDNITATQIQLGSVPAAAGFYALTWKALAFCTTVAPIYCTGSTSVGESATVNYNINGGTGTTPNSVSGVFGEIKGTVATDAAFNRPDYAFTGWNTEVDGSGAAYTPGAPLTIPGGTTTLYAQWSPLATFKVKVMSDGPQVYGGRVGETYDGVEVELSNNGGVSFDYRPMQVTGATGEADFGSVAPNATYTVRLRAPCDSRPVETEAPVAITTGAFAPTFQLAATVPCQPVLSYSAPTDTLSWTQPNDGGSTIRYYTYQYNTQARINTNKAWAIFARYWPAERLTVPFATYAATGCPAVGTNPAPAPYPNAPQCTRGLKTPTVGKQFLWRVGARNALDQPGTLTPPPFNGAGQSGIIGNGWSMNSPTLAVTR